jgi:hypothetical protein
MGQDIEAAPQARISEDNNSLKAPTRVGREELASIVHPHESYEGLHRYDPSASWSVEEERRVVRKTDMRLLAWLCLMMMMLQLNRGNVSNALADEMLKDLGLTSDDYNNGTTIQLLCFLSAEFPVQFLTKRYGFKYVLPTMMMLWGFASWASAFQHDRTLEGRRLVSVKVVLFLESSFSPHTFTSQRSCPSALQLSGPV